ncbi:MAG TPA: hypothetical protein O0X27_03490 [Methanocorpusculum sp.]|nr:hypothetical protein [Methanocorpusculum sp.]
MSHKNRIILLVSVVLALLLVISSAACVSQADTASQSPAGPAKDAAAGPDDSAANPSSHTNLTVRAAQKIDPSTGERLGNSSLHVDMADDIDDTDAQVITFDIDPAEILESGAIASLYFTVDEPWVLEAQEFLETLREYVEQTPSKKPFNLYVILYEYDTAYNRVFVGETPVRISADSVTIENGNAVFMISPDVISSGTYELLVSPYSGLSEENSYVYYDNMLPDTEWLSDLNIGTNAQFTTGSNVAQSASGIYRSEKSWKSVVKYTLPSIPWGFTQTMITAAPTVVPAYDPTAEYSQVALDMPWRLHWTVNDAASGSVSANASGSGSVQPSVRAVATASVRAAEDSEDAVDPEDKEGLDPDDEGGDDAKKSDTPSNTSSNTSKPAAVPAANASAATAPANTSAAAVNATSAKSGNEYYQSVEFILYRYENGDYRIVDSFGWNRGYSADREQYTDSYQPGTYALIAYLRGVGVILDFQKQQIV